MGFPLKVRHSFPPFQQEPPRAFRRGAAPFFVRLRGGRGGDAPMRRARGGENQRGEAAAGLFLLCVAGDSARGRGRRRGAAARGGKTSARRGERRSGQRRRGAFFCARRGRCARQGRRRRQRAVSSFLSVRGAGRQRAAGKTSAAGQRGGALSFVRGRRQRAGTGSQAGGSGTRRENQCAAGGAAERATAARRFLLCATERATACAPARRGVPGAEKVRRNPRL